MNFCIDLLVKECSRTIVVCWRQGISHETILESSRRIKWTSRNHNWVIGAYWWANTVPHRPPGVPAKAVFLWAPYTGLPGQRRGWWMTCWEETGHDWCRVSDAEGRLEYAGEFISYLHKESVSDDQLGIDAIRTREHKIWVGNALVPLVYLKNGKVLVPAAKYEDGVRLLDQLKQ